MERISRYFVKACRFISISYVVVSSHFVMANIALQTSDSNELRIQPNTCVSLHINQACFVNLSISWHTSNNDNYCLYSSAQDTPLKCWNASSQGVLTQQFGTKETLYFYLKVKKNSIVIAETELNVSWVYKKQQKSRLSWRLF